MVIAGSVLRFGFWLPADFPSVLPKVYGLSSEVRRLPHVDEHGFVCAFEDENTLIDYREAGALIVETVERARSVVEDGLVGRNSADFLAEFEAYWPRALEVASAVSPGDQAFGIKASFDGPRFLAVADSVSLLRSNFPNGVRQVKGGAYLPLKQFDLGALHPRDLCSWDVLLPLLSESSVAFAQTTRVVKKQSLPVVVGVQRADGGRALVGLVLRKFASDAPLFTARPLETRPFTLSRFDGASVRQRLVGTRPGARVVVVGCGAVGGHVAHALAWSGARELVLIDPDLGGPSNTFRHVLGRRGWGQLKVQALKRELERCIPGLSIVAVPKSVSTALAEQPDLLRSADVVVVAIGNNSTPLQLNDLLASSKAEVPVVFTWLEPYGIGGHAVLVDYSRPGCLRCLFNEHPTLECTVEFSEPGQRFGRRDVGCHALYTPYGDVDARTTALLAARLVRRATVVGERSGCRRSWRGDASAFVAAGFRLSPRYGTHISDAAAPLPPRSGCPACER